MKLTCVVLVLCVVLYAEAGGHHGAHHEKWMQAKTKCIQDGGLDENVIKSFFKNHEQDTQDENIKCFFKCFMQQMNTMDAEGNIVEPQHPEGAEGGNNEKHQKMAQAFNECKGVTGSNDCDKAFQFHKCFSSKKPSHSH